MGEDKLHEFLASYDGKIDLTDEEKLQDLPAEIKEEIFQEVRKAMAHIQGRIDFAADVLSDIPEVDKKLEDIRQELDDPSFSAWHLIFTVQDMYDNKPPEDLLERSPTLKGIVSHFMAPEETDTKALRTIKSSIVELSELSRSVYNSALLHPLDQEGKTIGGSIAPFGKNKKLSDIETTIIITRGFNEIEEQEDPEYDARLLATIYSIKRAGYSYVSIAYIARNALIKKGTPSATQIRKAEQRIDFWRQRLGSIDARAEYEKRREHGQKIPEGTIGLLNDNCLVMQKLLVWEGGRWVPGYHIKEIPIFIRYAIETGQYVIVPQHLLQLESVSATEQNIRGSYYILRKIKTIDRAYPNSIDYYENLLKINYEELGKAMKPGVKLNKNNMFDIRKLAKSYLDQMKKAKQIADWEEYPAGAKSKTGIRIIPRSIVILNLLEERVKKAAANMRINPEKNTHLISWDDVKQAVSMAYGMEALAEMNDTLKQLVSYYAMRLHHNGKIAKYHSYDEGLLVWLAK